MNVTRFLDPRVLVRIKNLDLVAKTVVVCAEPVHVVPAGAPPTGAAG